MANLTRTNWPLGWTPSEDAINGNPDGLLRADNIRFDKQGAATLVDGSKRISGSFQDFVENLYTKVINNREYFWVSTGNTGTTVARVDQNFSNPVSLLVSNGGLNNYRGVFGEALGYVIAIAGAMRTRDPINAAPTALGLVTPEITGSQFGPTGVVNAQGDLTLSAPTTTVWGTQTKPKEMIVDTTNLIGVLVSPTAFNLNTVQIGATGILRGSYFEDQVQFTIIPSGAVSDISSVEIQFILAGDPNTPASYTDYYSFVFDSSLFSGGVGQQVTLTARRGDFTRFGTMQSASWTAVIGVSVTITCSAQTTIEVGNIHFLGGSGGRLNGVYQYLQVNVRDDGRYVAKSPSSLPSDNFNVINGSVTLFGIKNEPNVTELRFYRRSVPDLGLDPTTGLPINQSTLNNYNYVGKAGTGDPFYPSFTDTLSDTEVLELNADGSLLPNLFLQSMNSRDATNGLQDLIVGMEGLYNERMLYLGPSQLYLSDRLNPDAVDSRFTLRPSGDQAETNLWIKKLTNNVLILATTRSLYEVTGTMAELPDGSIDVALISIGESHPPISVDVCNFNGGLYYIASDGLRVTRGSNSINVSPQLRHLFGDSKLFNSFVSSHVPPIQTRHGVPGVAIYQGYDVNYSICAAHQKIYFVLPMQDGSRRLFVYDTVTQTYHLMLTDPQKVFSTQFDEVIAGYGSGAANTLFVLDYTPGLGADGTGIPFKLRTIFDANQQPRNRKDTFTLKLVLDTGGRNVSVDIQKDGFNVTEFDETSWVNLGQVSANGTTTVYLSLAGVSLGFRYAVQISDVNGAFTFKLYEMTIEYEPRPEQVNWLRITGNNLGTICRKRFTSYAFVIDTLGNTVNFTPYLDNVQASTTSPLVTNNKGTFVYYFNSEAVGIDIGATLAGGPFEFYGLNLEESISEKLPSPATFLVIPANNYGTPNRKRHTSYKFQINTQSGDVRFAPRLDGTFYTPSTYNTAIKTTVEYFFPAGDIIGIDVGGTLTSLSPVPFEFYGTIAPQQVEVLPDRLKYFRIPNNNFEVAARKRIRTLPLVIDTYGNNVTFTPIVDGSQGASTTLNTNGKITAYHYFNSDVFGTDFGGILSGSNPFEFYGLGTPEDVEVLPVPKKFDQLGPMRFDKIGKIFGFRVRLIVNGTTTSMPYQILGDLSSLAGANPLLSGAFNVVPGYDEVYEIQTPRNVNTDIFRLVLGPISDSFHRYDVLVKVQSSGMEGQSKWLPIR